MDEEELRIIERALNGRMDDDDPREKTPRTHALWDKLTDTMSDLDVDWGEATK